LAGEFGRLSSAGVIIKSMSSFNWFVPRSSKGEFYIGERCYIVELLNCDSSPEVSLARARVSPGVTTKRHVLAGVTETYIIEQGQGGVEIDGERQVVAVGDQVIIRPGVSQCITNDGDDDLIFFCVCTPRFTEACYTDLE